MPEHDSGPGTDDLDTTFHGLVDDVGVRSRPPGADRAVRTAGVRRTTFAAGALAVVLVVAAGIGGWALQGSGRSGPPVVAAPTTTSSSSPASPSADPDVPAPAPVTLDRLNEASAGWTTWEEGTADVVDVEGCLRKDTVGPEANDGTIEHYHVGDEVDAFYQRERFDSNADANASLRARVAELESCPAKTESYSADVSADLEVVAYTWGTGDRHGAVWLVSFDDRLATFHVVGGPKPSSDVLNEVSRLIAADVQVP